MIKGVTKKIQNKIAIRLKVPASDSYIKKVNFVWVEEVKVLFSKEGLNLLYLVLIDSAELLGCERSVVLENTGNMKKIPIINMHKYDIISLFLTLF